MNPTSCRDSVKLCGVLDPWDELDFSWPSGWELSEPCWWHLVGFPTDFTSSIYSFVNLGALVA